MKQLITYTACIGVLLLSACEKVIDVDVKDAETKYVIEGWVADSPWHSFVKITTTRHLSDNNDFQAVTNAAVRVADENGNEISFSEEDGIYTPDVPSFAGVVGSTYTLTVDIEGEQFTASSTMPKKVKMDTLYITQDFIFGEVRKTANIAYKDPPGERNYYRFIQFIDGVQYNRVFISNDEYSDGKQVTDKLRTPSEDEEHQIETGSSVMVQALCIDKANNDYWTSFLTSGATGGSATASPANPTTNIRGGALGYFSAHTIEVLVAEAP